MEYLNTYAASSAAEAISELIKKMENELCWRFDRDKHSDYFRDVEAKKKEASQELQRLKAALMHRAFISHLQDLWGDEWDTKWVEDTKRCAEASQEAHIRYLAASRKP